MRRALLIVSAACLLAALPAAPGRACTNFLVTRGASADGSTMITYAADSHELYGELYFRPAASHKPGAMMKIHDWDTGKYLGQIKQARRTYRVVGNMNEHQVVIGETTYGGRKELKNPKGGIDYGSLMYVALQRARTARQAIKVMTDLVAEYGYYSSGESFSISDPREVWLMEMIGKGPGHKGAVWVARKVPDGHISGHANQARIRRFPLDDPDNTLYSRDVITFARKQGYFKGKDAEFSFADAYAPMTYRRLRCCEARVWQFFRRAAPKQKIPAAYIRGRRGARPMPLWIKPDRKLTVRDVIAFMRDHFEGSHMDLGKGVGAGPYGLPYRWRPLTWEYRGKKYVNERATSTQQTGFSFVSQSRTGLPGPIGGVLWFSVDDSYSTVYVPMYAGITKAPHNYAVGTGSFTEFSWDSAFWVFNWVANFAYSRYRDMIKDIIVEQKKIEDDFFRDQKLVEQKAQTLYRDSRARAERYLTAYSAKAARRAVDRWRRLGQELLMKYLDGNVRDAKGKVTHPGYPERWYRRIVRERGRHFRLRYLPGEPREPDKKKSKNKNKKNKKRDKKDSQQRERNNARQRQDR